MRLAHVSDAHLLDLAAKPSWKDRVVSVGRPLDAALRYGRLLAALRRAAQSAAHVLISGDLAETGSLGQYESLAMALDASGLDAGRVTMLPGNHDRYDADDAWERALRGPLAPWAQSAAHSAQHVAIELGSARLVAFDASRTQNILRSAGHVCDALLETLAGEARAAAAAGKHLVLALHHPPHLSGVRAWHAMNGLLGAQRLIDMMRSWAATTLLHGHTHTERMVAIGQHRAYSASATVSEGARGVAFYDVGERSLTRAAPTSLVNSRTSSK